MGSSSSIIFLVIPYLFPFQIYPTFHLLKVLMVFVEECLVLRMIFCWQVGAFHQILLRQPKVQSSSNISIGGKSILLVHLVSILRSLLSGWCCLTIQSWELRSEPMMNLRKLVPSSMMG